MTIDPNISVKQLIDSLEAEITEKQGFLKMIKAAAGMSSNGTAQAATPPVQAVQPPAKRRAKAPASNGTLSVADHTQAILRETGKPISKHDLRNKLTALGVDTSNKHFLTSMYTALNRRADVFYRDANQNWCLVEWRSRTA
jgi:hypothetical protein